MKLSHYIALTGAALLFCIIALNQRAEARGGPSQQTCVQFDNILNAVTMEANRTFEFEHLSTGFDFGLMTIYVELTDANTSITRFDMDCTGSLDNNTTDFIPQTCTVASGICTSNDSTWQIASPGTKNFYWRWDSEGVPDGECTFSVGTGTGAAIDLLTVSYTVCTKGG